MSHSLWTVPGHDLDPQTAKQRILDQHRNIRELIERARRVAELALDGRSPSDDAVASAIGDIRATQEVHLAFEEQVMPVILAQDPASAQMRMRRLREEHKDQRAVLVRAHEEAIAAPRLSILAAKLAFLTNWLLTDMEGEERILARYWPAEQAAEPDRHRPAATRH